MQDANSPLRADPERPQARHWRSATRRSQRVTPTPKRPPRPKTDRACQKQRRRTREQSLHAASSDRTPPHTRAPGPRRSARRPPAGTARPPDRGRNRQGSARSGKRLQAPKPRPQSRRAQPKHRPSARPAASRSHHPPSNPKPNLTAPSRAPNDTGQGKDCQQRLDFRLGRRKNTRVARSRGDLRWQFIALRGSAPPRDIPFTNALHAIA